MKKLNCILLVEDDDTTNFYHQFLIENLGIAEHVAVTLNGEEALSYLEKAGNGDAATPDLILLDINMPVMNGFEFIEQYELLPDDWKSKILVVMLTTSLHPSDLARACVAVEGASDPLMFPAPERLLWASRRAEVLETLPPLPSFDVLGGFFGPNRRTDPRDANFPDISDLMARLHFSTSDGRIWLDDQRMLLIHAKALGLLRRELIESLGIDAARGFMTRMGYFAGAHDAMMARKVRSKLSAKDMFLVGPQTRNKPRGEAEEGAP